MKNRYSRKSILCSEKYYGRGFHSPGGYEVLDLLFKTLELDNIENVLEVGSGLGATTHYFSKYFGAQVIGLDLSQDMVDICKERQTSDESKKVEFIQGDLRFTKFNKNHFDLIWTRETLLYIPENERKKVWNNFFSFLKPGGTLAILEWCRERESVPDEVIEYRKTSNHHDQYPHELLSDLGNSGFTIFLLKDLTNLYVQILKDGLNILQKMENEFKKDFTAEEFKTLVERVELKIRAFTRRDFIMTLVKAKKYNN